MEISKKHIELMAEWSKLWLDEEQKELLVREINETIKNISLIEELEVDNMELYGNDGLPINALREDGVQLSTEGEIILENSPDSYEGMFVVPKTLEEID